jgi:hypothetical protein
MRHAQTHQHFKYPFCTNFKMNTYDRNRLINTWSYPKEIRKGKVCPFNMPWVAHRGSRVIYLLMLNLGARRGGGCAFSVIPGSFAPGKEPFYPLYKRLGWTQGPIWMGVDNVKYLSPEDFEHGTIQLVAGTISGLTLSLFLAVISCIKFVQRWKKRTWMCGRGW